MSSANQFVLLNNEFREDQYLFGIEFYAAPFTNVTFTTKVTVVGNNVTTCKTQLVSTGLTTKSAKLSGTTKTSLIYVNKTNCSTFYNASNVSSTYSNTSLVNTGKITIQVKKLIKKILFFTKYINIKVVTFDACGSSIPCAAYFTNNPIFKTPNVSLLLNFTITSGYNKILFDKPYFIQKGSLIILTQQLNSSGIAIDQSGNASYSDTTWDTNLVNLNSNSTANWRFYFNTITNFTSYQSKFNLVHSYATIGLYEISILFTSSNQVFKQVVNITDCELFIFV